MASLATRGSSPRSIVLFLAGLVLGMAAAVLVVASTSGVVRADTVNRTARHGPAVVTPADMTRGGLLLRGGSSDNFRVAPDLATDVKMTVNGIVARTQVTQYFRNPYDEWQEGVYVFPLPDQAAVDTVRLRIGDRVIEGVIQERIQAKRTYEQARDAGKRAALVEEERPNIFTTSVANVGPGDLIVVEIGYQQQIRFDQNGYRLRFPMVVGPRYIPAGSGPGHAGFDIPGERLRVPDADRITPPVRHSDDGLSLPVQIRIELNPGFPVETIDSPYHPVTVNGPEDDRYTVTLAETAVPADRDFELVWRPAVEVEPAAAAFSEEIEDATYALLLVTPPPVIQSNDGIGPREVVFVIDTSGSMHGASIAQAKQALLLALDRLRPADTFNILRFNNITTTLFAAPRPATSRSVKAARAFVNVLNAEGGTEMLTALNAALDDAAASDSERLRQIVLLTDGAIGNETELFDSINQRLGRSRLFMVGIGSAPNGHLMREASELGRGTFTYIGKPTEVAEKMENLFAKLERPAVTNLRLELPDGVEAEIYPRRLPDAYAGEPVLVALRMDTARGSAMISGHVGQRSWQAEVPLTASRPSPGVGKIWARHKIKDLDGSVRDGIDPAVARAAIIDVALRHKLMSKYTSLVAVDTTPARTEGDAVVRREVPTNLPEGWTYDKVFGESGIRTAPARFGSGATPASFSLPQTATDAGLRISIGLFMLMLSAAGLLWIRRQKT